MYSLTQNDLLLLNMLSLQAQQQRQQALFPNVPNMAGLLSANDFPLMMPIPNLPLGLQTTNPISQVLLSETSQPSTPTEVTGEPGSRKRKLSAKPSIPRKYGKLSNSQKEKKSVREKRRRQIVANLFMEVGTKLLEKGLVHEKPQKLQRLGILKVIVKLFMPGPEYIAFEQTLEGRKVEVDQSLSKRRIKAINEKTRRDTLRHVLDTAAVLIGLEKHMDQAEVLKALLVKLDSV